MNRQTVIDWKMGGNGQALELLEWRDPKLSNFLATLSNNYQFVFLVPVSIILLMEPYHFMENLILYGTIFLICCYFPQNTAYLGNKYRTSLMITIIIILKRTNHSCQHRSDSPWTINTIL